MPQVSVLGIDMAKQLFHVVGLDDAGHVVLRKRLPRGKAGHSILDISAE